jgi:ubiquinone/menaquinone biosynthesis C-methylase UbiE
MSIYRDRILPHLIHLAMRRRDLAPYRQRVISAAEGQVLEIGIGSGLNLPFYAGRVRRVIGLEPLARLLAMARGAGRQAAAAVDLLKGSAEALPLENASLDTAVTTWTLCSVPDASSALREMRRVLRPSGLMAQMSAGEGKPPMEKMMGMCMGMCGEMLNAIKQTNALAVHATSELDHAFGQWLKRLEDQALDLMAKDAVDAAALAKELKINEASALYVLDRLAVSGKITLAGKVRAKGDGS